MTDHNAQDAAYKARYIQMNAAELISEYHHIREHASKENMLDDLIKMSALMNVMESKNVPMPENRQTNTAGYANHQPVATSNYQAPRYQAPAATGGVNWGKAVLGMVICLIGLGLTLSSDGAIFYGAILVGFFMMIGGFIGD